MLHHLLIDLVPKIPLIHHDNVLHSIGSVLTFIVIADLGNQLEQQFRAALIVNFRLLPQLLQNDLLRIIAVKINGIALDPLLIPNILQILQQQLVFYRRMGKLCQIQFKIYKGILLHTSIGHFDTRNGNEFADRSPVNFFRLLTHPSRERHFIILKQVAQIFVLETFFF